MATRKITPQTNLEENVKEEASKEVIQPKKFQNDDLIPCKSVTTGVLLVDGNKSGILYRWMDYGDIVDVEYQDLAYLTRARRPSVFKPRFIIMDEDFVEQNPSLKSLYTSMYTDRDFREIIELPVSQMKSMVTSMPEGAKSAFKGVVATMIETGQLDSIRKIKALDEILNTELLLALAQD